MVAQIVMKSYKEAANVVKTLKKYQKINILYPTTKNVFDDRAL